MARFLRLITRAFIAWSVLAAGVVGLMFLKDSGVVHHHATRRPEPFMRVHLTAAQKAAWQSIPDYTGAVPVLCYHGVGSTPETAAAAFLDVPRGLFAKTMLALKVGGFHAITLRQYVAWYDAWRNGKTYPLPPKPILLSFDDGRDDSYRATNTILRHYGFHAVELAVASWVTTNPGFSLHWTTMQSMDRSGVWTVQEHFGFGREVVPFRRYGTTGGRFAYLSWIGNVHHGHLESLHRFLTTFHRNMRWGERQMREHLPDYRPLAMALPSSDEGQNSNTPQIGPLVVNWLDQHFKVVFTGDYLYGGPTGTLLPYRLSKKLVFRLGMTSGINVTTLRCRIYDYVTRAPTFKEYGCPGLHRHRRVVWNTKASSTTTTPHSTASPVAPTPTTTTTTPTTPTATAPTATAPTAPTTPTTPKTGAKS